VSLLIGSIPDTIPTAKTSAISTPPIAIIYSASILLFFVSEIRFPAVSHVRVRVEVHEANGGLNTSPNFLDSIQSTSFRSNSERCAKFPSFDMAHPRAVWTIGATVSHYPLVRLILPICQQKKNPQLTPGVSFCGALWTAAAEANV
jgi:hypothetical protein